MSKCLDHDNSNDESNYAEFATWAAAIGVAYLPIVAMLMNH